MAASFQKTILEILFKKTKVAINEFKKINKGNQFIIAGGVASNNKIREVLKKVSCDYEMHAIFPNKESCTDNAAMIAIAGLERFKKGNFDNLDFSVKPRWPLDPKAAFLKGAGVKL